MGTIQAITEPMEPHNTDTDEAYQTYILQGVSRTFALTIPELPSPLCHVVGNGYLLCRIADTIEDDPYLTADHKGAFAAEFVQVVAGRSDAGQFSEHLLSCLSDATPTAEKNLIANTHRVIRLTRSFSATQYDALLKCVHIMAEGMTKFQQHYASPHGLDDLEKMDHYCYYVAGVVGEMLTNLFCDYSAEIGRQQDELQQLSVSFGQGLQMTNILKDIWDDQQRQACWLPRDIFQQYGADLQHLSNPTCTPAFTQALNHLIAIAREHLCNGLRYVLLIPSHEVGIRRFCLYALGMAVLTLRRIHQQPDFRDSHQVKISRRSVRNAIRVSNLAVSHDMLLKLLFWWLTHPLKGHLTKKQG